MRSAPVARPPRPAAAAVRDEGRANGLHPLRSAERCPGWSIAGNSSSDSARSPGSASTCWTATICKRSSLKLPAHRRGARHRLRQGRGRDACANCRPVGFLAAETRSLARSHADKDSARPSGSATDSFVSFSARCMADGKGSRGSMARGQRRFREVDSRDPPLTIGNVSTGRRARLQPPREGPDSG